MNIMTVEVHKAKIEYDPEIDMSRGEILGLNGGADFYGKTPDELRLEFKKSYPFTGSTDLIDDLSQLKRNDSFGT